MLMLIAVQGGFDASASAQTADSAFRNVAILVSASDLKTWPAEAVALAEVPPAENGAAATLVGEVVSVVAMACAGPSATVAAAAVTAAETVAAATAVAVMVAVANKTLTPERHTPCAPAATAKP
jgi:hypothetical protein